jgi:hypothetical protein
MQVLLQYAICLGSIACLSRMVTALAKVAKELGNRWRRLNPNPKTEGGSEAQNKFITKERTAWEKAPADEKNIL